MAVTRKLFESAVEARGLRIAMCNCIT